MDLTWIGALWALPWAVRVILWVVVGCLLVLWWLLLEGGE